MPVYACSIPGLIIYLAYATFQNAMMESQTAKLFVNGRSQAVRIPKAYQFKGINEVAIRKEGDSLIITPVRKTWESFIDEAPAVGDDFMSERPELLEDERVTF